MKRENFSVCSLVCSAAIFRVVSQVLRDEPTTNNSCGGDYLFLDIRRSGSLNISNIAKRNESYA